MGTSMFTLVNKFALIILCVIGLIELGLAVWTIVNDRYKVLAYNLSDVGYIDLWILRYLSMCYLASSIIILVMCLILIWGLYSTHVFIFISSTMIAFVVIAEFTISMLAFTSKFQTRVTLQEQLPKLVITYRQGNDERASRALDYLQSAFRCCGAEGRLSYQNNVPSSCTTYSVGCLPCTMYFLDSCMDILAYILLFFSVIKLVIIIYFYSFLCIYERYQQNSKNTSFAHESPRWNHSSSSDSSTENITKKILALTNQDKSIKHDNDYGEKRRIILNEYDSQLANKRVQNAAVILPTAPLQTSLSLTNNLATSVYEPHVSRKLSSISERTEKTETDDSEPELLRMKQYNSKRNTSVVSVGENLKQPPPLPTKLPVIKNRKKNGRDDDNDSGVEHSPSEKSFDDQNTNKRNSDCSTSVDTNIKPKAATNKFPVKTPPTLSFSNVFVTSVSLTEATVQSQNNDIKKPITTSPSSSSSLSDQLLLSDVATPKPILKKSNSQSSPPSSDQDRIPPSYQDQKKISPIITTKSYVKLTEPHAYKPPLKTYTIYKTKENSRPNNIPKPAPRPSLKQSLQNRQDESLV